MVRLGSIQPPHGSHNHVAAAHPRVEDLEKFDLYREVQWNLRERLKLTREDRAVFWTALGSWTMVAQWYLLTIQVDNHSE